MVMLVTMILDGDANDMTVDSPRVMTVMKNICSPFPTKTDKSIPLRGGRNTSPWTSFHPNSSCASSYREEGEPLVVLMLSYY